MQPIGQVGSVVRLPQGPIELLATVSMVGIAELSGALPPSSTVQNGDRWLQVQLIGEVDALGRFQRGVSKYPGLDDPVHFATEQDLRAIYPPEGDTRIRIGCLASAPEVPLTFDAQKLVTRHGALVGSTGSGKSTAVVTLVRSFLGAGWTSANIIIVDPHGEYGRALKDYATVRSVLGEDAALLRVPYWALPAADILRAFAGSLDHPTSSAKFNEFVAAERTLFAKANTWLDIDSSAVNADTPIPFNLRNVWFRMDSENKATYSSQGGNGDLCLKEEGSAADLKSNIYEMYGLGAKPPFRGPGFGSFGSIPERMRKNLLDPKYKFFREPYQEVFEKDPLPEVLQEWIGGTQPVSVLDFSGVPSTVTDLAVGTVLQLIFEVATRSQDTGIGRCKPVLIVLEEAHRYLGEQAYAKLARESANRIAREGRKYGVGLLLVTQRPSELPPTALAQCGTLVALRLTNASDQGTVRTALPDSITGLADILPSLRTGEALVTGEAVALPSRACIDLPHPEPDASDPSLDSWRATGKDVNLTDCVARWRSGS